MKEKSASILKTAAKVILWIAGIWATLLVILQTALSPSVLTGLANKYAAPYVEGRLHFGKASINMFSHFPDISINLEELSVTYPAIRFDEQEQLGVQGHLLKHGCGQEEDTLAYFKHFSASINAGALLFGNIRLPHISLSSPRVFIHNYADGSSNLDILTPGTSPENIAIEVTDTAGTSALSNDDDAADASSFPDIIIGKARLTGHPHIVYTDSRDTIFAIIDLKQSAFDGRLHTGKTHRNRIGMSIDSMFIAGRMAADTLAFGLDRLHIHEHGRHMDLHADAKTFLATRSFGRMRVPVSLEGRLSFPKDTAAAINIESFKADIAYIPVEAYGSVRFMTGRTGIDASVNIRECRINDIIEKYLSNIIPETAKVGTDATVSLSAQISGEYDHATGRLPHMHATMKVPDSQMAYEGIDENMTLRFEVGAATDAQGRINVSIDTVNISSKGILLSAAAGVHDILGDDPLLDVDGEFTAVFDSLATLLPDSLEISGSGTLSAIVEGSARVSQLDIYNFSKSDLSGAIKTEKILFDSPKDSISAEIGNMEIRLAPEERSSKRDNSITRRLIALNGSIGSIDVSYKNALNLTGEDVRLSARNIIAADTVRINPLKGNLSAKKLYMTDASGLKFRLENTSNTFGIRPKRGQPQVPVLSLASNNKRLGLVTRTNRVILTDASFSASAAMNTLEKKARRNAFLDSLAKVYPDIPRDSLFAHSRSLRKTSPLPDYLKEEDFKKQDPDLRLDETMAKYFREWDIDGDIDIRTGIVMTPYFPIRNILRGFKGHINNNEIGIDSIKVMSGNSEIAATGKLSGLKRALLGRGIIKLDLDVTSEGMNANQLLAAYTKGAQFKPETLKGKAELSDADFLKMVTVEDTAKVEAASSSLFVIPANVNAEISIDASGIKYSDLNIDKLKAELVMKERCVQITNTSATSNMGDINFDAFYSTRTKKDLQTGFNLNFVDITAEKVISLMPAIDTLMPMLKSFKGLLNCEMAATARLDTNMNISTKSIDGVLRISGEDLSISDNEMFHTLAKKLLFKNKKEGKIEKMTVEGLIKDNSLEVFPFVMKVDRYTLAMSGIQNLDMSFRYHVSVLKSPFLIRLGIDLYGQDFDHMKFKIGKAKYKNTNVPVFATVIDLAKFNLVESIRGIFEKGVEAAVTENRKQSAIIEHKREIGYVQAVDQELEALSEEEQRQLEAEESAEADAQNNL